MGIGVTAIDSRVRSEHRGAGSGCILDDVVICRAYVFDGGVV